MEFKAPLKVFLSYSHGDNPKLFREFRNQLTSLEHDGVIKVWSDRDVSAGLKWEREIEKRLYECDLFLALTSADFNASDYISGIEMQAAWDRYDNGHCRIVPIMWRQWRPPDRLRALQFLPSLDRAVADARKKDDVLFQIVVKIEGLVKEMTEGRWTPDRPSLEALPSELAYQCDWMSPINKLGSLRPSAVGARQPGVLILTGTLDDCAEAFLARIHRNHLPLALNAQRCR
jgi:hypothetical protein